MPHTTSVFTNRLMAEFFQGTLLEHTFRVLTLSCQQHRRLSAWKWLWPLLTNSLASNQMCFTSATSEKQTTQFNALKTIKRNSSCGQTSPRMECAENRV